jgi:hypothetical protein
MCPAPQLGELALDRSFTQLVFRENKLSGERFSFPDVMRPQAVQSRGRHSELESTGSRGLRGWGPGRRWCSHRTVKVSSCTVHVF